MERITERAAECKHRMWTRIYSSHKALKECEYHSCLAVSRDLDAHGEGGGGM